MKNKIYRWIAFLLAVVALAAATPAGAADLADTGRELEAYVDENYGQFPGLARRDLFYVTAIEVSNLLTTYNHKYVTRSSLDYDYVYFSGKFTHTISTAAKNGMRAGLCRYDVWDDRFYPEFFMIFESGVPMKCENIAKDDFVDGIRYYGFVKNLYPIGTVSGNLYVVGTNR